MPFARITDQLCASEVHQAGFSSVFYYPLSYLEYKMTLKSQMKSPLISKQSFSTVSAESGPSKSTKSHNDPLQTVDCGDRVQELCIGAIFYW